MNCVYCNASKTSITNSRSTKSSTQTWRRHYCKSCKRTYSTFERPDMKHLAVDKDGSLEPYSHSKLQLSIIKCFTDTKLNYTLIDSLTDTIEIKLLKLANPTITNKTIAETVLKTLKPINKRAYLHYLADYEH